jgi:hypothetical protein
MIPIEIFNRIHPYGNPFEKMNFNYLGATTYPVMSFQVFRLGAIRTDTCVPSKRNPGHPHETFNLREMFTGSEFDQDLSEYRTRWAPVKGAFTYNEYADWMSETTFSQMPAGLSQFYLPQMRPYNVCGGDGGVTSPLVYGFGKNINAIGTWWNANRYNNSGQNHYGSGPMTYYAPKSGKYYPDVFQGASMKPISKQEYDGITRPYAYEMTYKQRLNVKQWYRYENGNYQALDMWIHYLHHPKAFSDEVYLPQDKWPRVLVYGSESQYGGQFFDWITVPQLEQYITDQYTNRGPEWFAGFSLPPAAGLPIKNNWPDELGPIGP